MTSQFLDSAAVPVPTPAPSNRPRIIEFEGRRIEVPHDATDAEIEEWAAKRPSSI